jgi:hypothetical protein
MLPQSKRIWPSIVTVVAVVFAINNPEKAADLVHKVVDAISTFASGL